MDVSDEAPGSSGYSMTTEGGLQSGALPADAQVVEDGSIRQASARWRRTFDALRERDFRIFWFGMLPGILCMQMEYVTNGYLAFELTGSATAVGFVELGLGVPILLLSLFAGVVADRSRKRQVMLITQTIISLAVALLAVLVILELVTIWQMALVAAVMASAFAFNAPARQAYLPEIVSGQRMTNAVALNNAGRNMARIVGPALAGVLISVPFIGIKGVYVIMAAMYGTVAVSLLFLPERAPQPDPDRASGVRQLTAGVHYIWRNDILKGLMILAYAPVLLGHAYVPLMPVFAEDVFGVGSSGLGLLMTVNGIGALAGSLLIASYSDFKRRGLLQLILGIALGVSLVAFAFSQSFVIALLILPVVGAASAAYLALNTSIMMDYCEPRFLGRVMSVNMITFSLAPIAVLPTGALMDLWGAPLVIGAGGLLLVVVMLIYLASRPAHRQLA